MKKPDLSTGAFHGATEQNLLKLLNHIIDDPAFGFRVLPEPKTSAETVIY